jgi:ATP-binding cassette subfamily B protein
MVGLLVPHAVLVGLGLLSLLVVAGAQLVSPQLIRFVIDEGLVAGNGAQLATPLLLLVLAAALAGVFGYIQGYLAERVSQDVAFDLRNRLFARIESLSFSYHDRAQTGQLMTRLTSDVEQVRAFLGQGVLQLLSAAVLLVGSLVILFLENWRRALVTVLTVPSMAVVLGRFVRRVRPLFGEVQARLGTLNTVLQENLVGVRVVQAFAREPYEAQRYERTNAALLSANVKTVRGLAASFPLIWFISNLGIAAVVWIGGLEIIGGDLSYGQLAAFMRYLSLLMMPLMMLGMITGQLARAVVSADRIFEILDATSDIRDAPDATVLPPVAGRVAFDGVSFRYAGAERDTLSDVSFVAEPGQTVAIMGQTGSGKSSIINLIPRFYDPVAGRVTIDGHDVRQVTLESLRRQIGIVLQDTTLMSGTLRDNIAYGRPDASDADIEAAARAAQAHDFIAAFPQGYQTLVGERGVGLSGGQRQRIAIARALLLDPRILILDDSTSAVDAETEYQLQQALDALMRGRTAFVIAQRISTVRDADLILLIDEGRIVARGTHDELLRDSALYGEILDSQFGRAEVTP